MKKTLLVAFSVLLLAAIHPAWPEGSASPSLVVASASKSKTSRASLKVKRGCRHYAEGEIDSKPLTGDNSNPEIQAEDVLKNRQPGNPGEPKAIETNATLASLLAPQADAETDKGRFSESKGAVITGYVRKIVSGGCETCEYHSDRPEDLDTHIDLVTDPDHDDAAHTVVVEVNHWWRSGKAKQGVDWSTTALHSAYYHQWVKVTGWLFFDGEHKGAAANLHPGRVGTRAIQRGTCWEIHPITDIQEVPRRKDAKP